MREDTNPFGAPDIDFYGLSYEHALAEGRAWRFGFNITIAATGGIVNLCMFTAGSRLVFRNFILRVRASGNANAVTEILYEFFEGTVFDDQTGTPLPIYAMNRNVQIPPPGIDPVILLNPTVSVDGILAGPSRQIDQPGQTVGNIEDGAASILLPDTGYMVRITNLDTASEHNVDVQAAFSFPDIAAAP